MVPCVVVVFGSIRADSMLNAQVSVTSDSDAMSPDRQAIFPVTGRRLTHATSYSDIGTPGETLEIYDLRWNYLKHSLYDWLRGKCDVIIRCMSV